MNSSGYVGLRQSTLFKLNRYYCVLFGSKARVRVMIRIRFSVWLVSGYAHVFALLSTVTVSNRR